MTDITQPIRDALAAFETADSYRDDKEAVCAFHEALTRSKVIALLARLDAAEKDAKLLDWLDRELACPLTLHDGRYLNLGDKGVRQVISEAMKGKP